MPKTIKKATKILSLILVAVMIIQTSPIISVAESETDSSLCPCLNCSEYNCACVCISEAVCNCVQCKRRVNTVYDNYGNLISNEVFDGKKTLKNQNIYSSDGGHLLASVDFSGNSVYYEYNEDEFPTKMTSGDTVIDFTYNALGQLTQVSQAVSDLMEGTTISNQYSYTDNKITSITHNGFSYNFTYDSYGNQTVVKINDQVYLTNEYGGKNNDRLGKVNYSNGQSVTYLYDINDNITGISYNNGVTYAFIYEYDSDNVLTKITDNNAGYIICYTDTATEIRNKSDNSLMYSSVYNNDGSETETIYDSTINYEYINSYNQITGETVVAKNATVSTTYEEDSVENALSRDINSSVTTDWFNRTEKKNISVNTDKINTETDKLASYYVSGEYNYTYNDTVTTASTKIASHSSSFSSSSYINNRTDYYEYDASGNIEGIYRYVNGVKTYFYQYEYDEAGQLVRENNKEKNITITYHYDAGGNLVGRREYGYTTEDIDNVMAYDAVMAYGFGNDWADEATLYLYLDMVGDSSAASNITYDNMGNTTSINGYSLTWQAGRQLNTVTNDDGSYQKYYYNSDGYVSRVDAYDENSEYINSYQFIWDGEKLVAKCTISADGSKIISRLLYDSDGEAYGFVLNDSLLYLYRKNLLGDVTGIIDGETGNLIAECSYDAYGNMRVQETSIVNIILAALTFYTSPILYRGYVHTMVGDNIAYYLGSRFYMPMFGRFLNADKHFDTGTGVIGTNMFAYCNNNPVMFTDATGESILGAVAGVLGLTTVELVCMTVLLMIMADVLTGGKVILSFSEAVALIIESISYNISSSVVISKTTNIPSKLKDGDKVKTPDTHPNEFDKIKGSNRYRHKKTGWEFKIDKSGHNGGPHWDARPGNGKTGDYKNISLEGDIL